MDQRFRLYLGSDYASQDQLDMVEEILVEQELDAIWEAKIKFNLCLDDDGSWSDDVDEFLHGLARGRIELKLGDGEYTPLIDGPVIGHESNLSSEPGVSTITLVIADDSVYINQEANYEPHAGRKPHEIAETLFSAADGITSSETDPVDRIPSALQESDVQNETNLEFLRRLGERHERFVFVKPGLEPGTSIGQFKSPPAEITEGVADLILLGSDRNLQTFEMDLDNQSPRQVSASALSFTDKAVLTRTSSSLNESVFGSDNEEGLDPSSLGLDFLPPGFANSEDPEEAVNAQAGRNRYQYQGTGAIIPGCYSTILQPLNRINIQAGETPLAGEYIVRKVTHRITRNQYTQDITVMRDGALAGIGTSLIPNIF